jgi:hypothetical protein
MSNEQGQQLGIDMANNLMLMTLLVSSPIWQTIRTRFDPTLKKPCSI